MDQHHPPPNELSLASGLAGLITTADKIALCLFAFTSGMIDAPNLARSVVAETQALSEIFAQLGTVLWGRERRELKEGRAALVCVDQLVLTVSACVASLAELEKEMEGVGKADMTLQFRMLDRLRWTVRENAIRKILENMQMQKGSLVFVLTILTVLVSPAFAYHHPGPNDENIATPTQRPKRRSKTSGI